MLSTHKSKPSRSDRGKFPAGVVKQLIKQQGKNCFCGCGRLADQTHHVMPRGRSGRGVITNGMRVNGICNVRFHDNEDELQKWITVWTKKHGDYFWYDKQDWEEHHEQEIRKPRIIKQVDRITPIINLLVAGAGRKLTPDELHFVDQAFSGRLDVPIFTNLLNEIVSREDDCY